jgi:hypothetical protein
LHMRSVVFSSDKTTALPATGNGRDGLSISSRRRSGSLAKIRRYK